MSFINIYQTRNNRVSNELKEERNKEAVEVYRAAAKNFDKE